jgi:hypothetical protein
LTLARQRLHSFDDGGGGHAEIFAGRFELGKDFLI